MFREIPEYSRFSRFVATMNHSQKAWTQVAMGLKIWVLKHSLLIRHSFTHSKGGEHT